MIFQLGLTYLEIQREVDGAWRAEYTDADWSTRMHWNATDSLRSTADDVNLFSALFDVIADTTGLKFDFAKAKALYNERNWLDDVFKDHVIGSKQIPRNRWVALQPLHTLLRAMLLKQKVLFLVNQAVLKRVQKPRQQECGRPMRQHTCKSLPAHSIFF